MIRGSKRVIGQSSSACRGTGRSMSSGDAVQRGSGRPWAGIARTDETIMQAEVVHHAAR